MLDYKGFKIENITVEDMPNELFEDIAVICGLDIAVALLDKFAGNEITVPKNGFEKIEKKIILTEYDGSAISIKRLARQLQQTEKTIRNILSKYRIEPAVEGQVSLFKKSDFEIPSKQGLGG